MLSCLDISANSTSLDCFNLVSGRFFWTKGRKQVYSLPKYLSWASIATLLSAPYCLPCPTRMVQLSPTYSTQRLSLSKAQSFLYISKQLYGQTCPSSTLVSDSNFSLGSTSMMKHYEQGDYRSKTYLLGGLLIVSEGFCP